MRDGTPLPSALSGNIVERLVRLDESLLYLVNGSLSYLVNREPLEQTGTLTPEQAKDTLNDMLTVYFKEPPMKIPVGASMTWHTVTPPANWLFCVGGLEQVSEWPELFALWGYKYGGSGSQFQMPAFTDHSPMGAGGSLLALDTYAGSDEHTLDVTEIPAHRHTQRIGTGGGTNALAVSTTNNANSTVTRDNLNDTGGGLPHNNLSPVFGVFFIVYAGKHVT